MNTTISISKEMKEKLKNLGRTGETYEDVIQRMYTLTCNHLLEQFLYDTSNSISIDQAIAESKKKWQK